MLHHLHPEHHDTTVIKVACITCRDVHYAHPAKETGGQDMGGYAASLWRKCWILKMLSKSGLLNARWQEET